jgi:uncharacterized membrane protein (UPF0127 family)
LIVRKGWVLINGVDCGVRGNRCEGFVERARGLLGRPALESTEALWISPCPGVHTLGMRYPIDVIFCDGDGRIVSIVESLRPGRVASAKDARDTCEMLAGAARVLGLTAGDRLAFADDLGGGR